MTLRVSGPGFYLTGAPAIVAGEDLVLRCRFVGAAERLSRTELPLYWRARYRDWGLDAFVDGQWPEDGGLDASVRECDVFTGHGIALGSLSFGG